jgi:Fungal N-terminal domain of STAND proteins
MDPLSIIAGTTGTVSFAIASAAMLNNFINSILDAPADIAEIARDVDALSKILNTLQGWLEKDVIRPSAARSLSESLNACVTSMNQLRLAIQPYTKETPSNRATLKWHSSFRWTFKRQEIRGLRDKLQHGKTTLSISISIINT